MYKNINLNNLLKNVNKKNDNILKWLCHITISQVVAATKNITKIDLATS